MLLAALPKTDQLHEVFRFLEIGDPGVEQLHREESRLFGTKERLGEGQVLVHADHRTNNILLLDAVVTRSANRTRVERGLPVVERVVADVGDFGAKNSVRSR